MAINKKLIHFNNLADFCLQKFAANVDNTKYSLISNDDFTATEPVTGEPDIKYQSIVFCREGQIIWTHGQIYHAKDYSWDISSINDKINKNENDLERFIPGYKHALKIADEWDASTTEMVRTFADDKELKTLPDIDTSNVTKFEYPFSGSGLEEVKKLDTSNATSLRGLFGSTNLINCPILDTSKSTLFFDMFYDCQQLQSVPWFDITALNDSTEIFWESSNHKDLGETVNQEEGTSFPENTTEALGCIYQHCGNLTTVPDVLNKRGGFYNIELVPTVTRYVALTCMFNNCYNLIQAPPICLTYVVGMNSMFKGCAHLKEVNVYGNSTNLLNLGNAFAEMRAMDRPPYIDTKNVRIFSATFSVSAIKEVPEYNYQNATAVDSLFMYCSNLEYIPKMNTSKCVNFWYVFHNCKNLKVIKEIDLKNLCTQGEFYKEYIESGTGIRTQHTYDKDAEEWSWEWFLGSCPKLEYMVIKNLGYRELAPHSISFSSAPWGRGSEQNRKSLIDSLITYSFDRAKAGYPSMNIKLSTTTKNILTNTEKAQIVAKGYTLI